VQINGGNHSQFGYYGSQLGDNPATISRVQQLSFTVNAILSVLSNVQGQ